MGKVGLIVLSIMALLALLVVCFGIGARTDFISTFKAFMEPLSSLSDFGVNIVRTMFVKPCFLDSDKIVVYRYYFDNDIYCDNAKLDKWYAETVFVYSNDGRVVDCFGDTRETRVWLDSNEKGIYKQGMFQKEYRLKTTWGDYKNNYMLSSNKTGFK